MSELVLINPRRRGSRKRKMTAKQRQFFGPRPKRRKFKARVRRARARTLMALPKKRRRVARYRRNPIGGFSVKNFAKDTLIPSGIGAAGALGLDLLLGFLPLPAAIKTGPMRPLVKLVGAVGLGMVAGMVGSRKMAEQVTAGAVTVVLYDTIKGFAQKQFPTLPLSDADYSLEYINPAQVVDGMSDTDALVDDSDSMGEYVDGVESDSEIGEYLYQ